MYFIMKWQTSAIMIITQPVTVSALIKVTDDLLHALDLGYEACIEFFLFEQSF